MLREFSKELEQDREFEIGGQVFKFRYPHWSEGARLFDEELKDTGNGDGTFSWVADTEMAIERIPMFLEEENDAHERFRQLIERKRDAIPRQQVVELYRWLVQVTSDLPTRPPSESAPGGGSTETSSAGAESSPEAPTTA